MATVAQVRNAVLQGIISIDPYEWGPWKKKFAFLPVKINDGRLWMAHYYERIGRNKYAVSSEGIRLIKVQRGTLFDVLKT